MKTKRKNIAVLGPLSAVHTSRWANSLSDSGHHINVITPPNHKVTSHFLSEKVRVHTLKYSGGKGYLLNIIELKRVLNRIQPDILMVHYASGYGTLAGSTGFRPYILVCWGSDIFEFPKRSFLHKVILRRNLARADLVTATSEFLKNEISKYAGVEKLRTLIFGVDTERFKPHGPKARSPRIIGVVKSLRPIYGIEDFVRAARIVKNKRPKAELEFHIYGEGPLKEPLMTLAKELGVAELVLFKGAVPNEELPSILNKMSVFCATSRQESFGVSLVEALSCELPVVASDIPAYREILKGVPSSLFYQGKDPESLASKIIELIENIDEYTKRAEGSHAYVRKLFSLEKSMDQCNALFAEINR